MLRFLGDCAQIRACTRSAPRIVSYSGIARSYKMENDGCQTYQLPYQDRRGFTNCLLSAIGGDGANMAAKLLFKIAAEELNLDGAYDAKYGSEKKGTPTDVSLRLCYFGTPVRESGPNNRPHILCAFRENLIRSLSLNQAACRRMPR